MMNEWNPKGTFLHPKSGEEQHMCFTGGEPLMARSQLAVIDILREFKQRGNLPLYVTFETNGTQPLTKEFVNFFNEECPEIEVFFSVSPKLFTVSGEQNKKAIRPEIVQTYSQIHNSHGQLKFVMGAAAEQWEELDDVIVKFRINGVNWKVYIMPVGATEEDQLNTAGEVATMAFQRGYNISARVHCYLWGNVLGV